MTSKATFGMNCFWEPQDFFSKVEGVTATRVGYTGGTKENPTYTDLGDHTEAVEIEFDPNQISYEELLQHFFKEHDPSKQQKAQYKSVIFYHDDEQQRLANEAKGVYEKGMGQTVLTEITPAKTFYPAEEYHQFYLKKANEKAS